MTHLAGIPFVAVSGIAVGANIAALALTAAPAATEGQAARPPELGYRKEPNKSHGHLHFVTAAFPDVPGFTCESWCYESAVEFEAQRALADGRLELRHRSRNQEHVVFVTEVRPGPGAVEFVARAELDATRKPGAKLPEGLPSLNMCFQLRAAEGFRSAPDPYPDFVKRCFIFTDKGRTFLLDTHRRPAVHRWLADHEYNNPPWVQMYVGTWRTAPGAQGKGWAEYSTDRYTVPVVGTVSRDGKYLTAIANGSADMLAQAWHDCLHNNPKWLPAGVPPEQQRWRVKVYVMENEPEALLERVRRDFPGAATLGGGAVGGQ